MITQKKYPIHLSRLYKSKPHGIDFALIIFRIWYIVDIRKRILHYTSFLFSDLYF